jgi:hypothetical protein
MCLLQSRSAFAARLSHAPRNAVTARPTHRSDRMDGPIPFPSICEANAITMTAMAASRPVRTGTDRSFPGAIDALHSLSAAFAISTASPQRLRRRPDIDIQIIT